MFEGLLEKFLLRLFGEYIENLNREQLRVSVWAGDIVLRNLKLKRGALDSLLEGLVYVHEGFLDQLTIKVPWTSLYSNPVEITVNGFSVLLGSQAQRLQTAHEVRALALRIAAAVKNRALQQYELEKLQREANESGKNPNSGGQGASLVEKILANVQVTVTKVHVRYEDNTSITNRTFAVGLTVDEFRSFTTDESGYRGYVDPGVVSSIHREVRLNGCGIYWACDSARWGTLQGARYMDSLTLTREANRKRVAANNPNHPSTLDNSKPTLNAASTREAASRVPPQSPSDAGRPSGAHDKEIEVDLSPLESASVPNRSAFPPPIPPNEHLPVPPNLAPNHALLDEQERASLSLDMYLVDPFQLSLGLVINKQASSERPKLHFNLTLQAFALKLTNHQYGDIVAVLDNLSAIKIRLEMAGSLAKLDPFPPLHRAPSTALTSTSTSVVGHRSSSSWARGHWRHAIALVLQLRRKRSVLDWKTMKRYLSDRKRYALLFPRSQHLPWLSELTETEAEELSALENRLSVEAIVAFRALSDALLAEQQAHAGFLKKRKSEQLAAAARADPRLGCAWKALHIHSRAAFLTCPPSGALIT